MIKPTKNLGSKTTGKTYKTQKEAVMNYLRRNSRSKMTAEQICNGINSTYNLKLTVPQVSQCLSRFSGTIVNKHDSGTTTTGRKVWRWAYMAPKS